MGVVGRIAERLTARHWTHDDAEAMIGHFGRTWIAHAAADDIRDDAASGGAVSALLIDALTTGSVRGALVCRTAVEDGKVRAAYAIATTAEEVLSARGSTYVVGDFAKEAVPLIEAFDGPLAVVALPCEIDFLDRRPELSGQVALRIALFCGHASEPALVDAVVARMGQEAEGELAAFRFRRGHWRGTMHADFDDGTTVVRPFSEFGTLQNLYLFCARKCLACGDHFGYAADVCAGDVWSQRFADDPIKHTSLIAKTGRGLAAVEGASERGVLDSDEVPVDVVLDGQRRTAPFHHNVTARHQAGRRAGITIPDLGQRVRWHELWAARIVVRNYGRTEGADGAERVLARPGILWKLQLWLLKGLESLS